MPDRYNIVLIAHYPGLREALLGIHREVIETMQWGLTALGHDVTTSIDTFSEERINIVIGSQMLPVETIEQMPSSTIIYNLEQISGLLVSQMKPMIPALARTFQIWDYSERNIQAWASMHPIKPAVHVPIGWAPILERIPRAPVQDIDVLFYGGLSPARIEVFNSLGLISSVFAVNLFGKSRDSLIARSKLVLNINRQPSRIFEIVRVSYLLANAKAVVADSDGDTVIENDIRNAVAFARLRKTASLCNELIADDSKRHALEKRGQEIFRKRDIRAILASALALS